MTQPTWDIDCLTDWSQVWEADFLARWSSLSERSGQANVFFTVPLAKAWINTYRRLAKIEPRFLVGRTTEGSEALLPMVLYRRGWKGGWLRSLEPVGANEFDYHDPLVSGNGPPGPLRQSFWSAAVHLLRPSRPAWDVLHIPRLRLPPSLETLPTASSDAAPFIDLSMFSSFDTYLASRPSQHRQDLRRQQRRLSERGPMKLQLHSASDQQALQRAIAHLAAHRRSRWPNAYQAPGLLECMVQEGLTPGVAQVAELWAGDTPVAWHLGFAHRGAFHYYMPAFDPGMASYSPGKVLLSRLIEESMRLGFSRFDLLSGQEPYKAVWQTGEVPLSTIEERQEAIGTRIRTTASRTMRRLASIRRRCMTRTAP